MLGQWSLRVVKGAGGFRKSTADVIVGISPFDVWLQRTQCEVILNGNRKLPATGDFGNDLRLVGGVVILTDGRVCADNKVGQGEIPGVLLDALVHHANF